MSRRYPPKDLKLLWGSAAGHCSFPDCHQECLVEATLADDAAIIGKIAHICAHSDEGPRANPHLTVQERDCYDNWILLCGTHHDMVDAQPNTYTDDDLRGWKRAHEKWVHQRLAIEMPEVTSAELEIVTQAILVAPSPPSTDFTAPDPQEKMTRNNLTDSLRFLITLGLGKFREVEVFVQQVASLDPAFPERLKNGFVLEYNRLCSDGFDGDSLFEALHEFANGRSTDFQRQAAGLAVLVYLFQKCEVFEE